MSNKQHTPLLGEQGNDAEIPKPGSLTAFHTQRWSSRWSARRRRDAWFLLGVLLFGVVTIFALSNGIAQRAGQANGTRPTNAPGAVTQAQPSSTSVVTATAEFREYPFPQSDSQVMRLAVDHLGRVWVGEMGRNYLAVFDPRTQTFQQMIPPGGRYGMMGIQVAADDTIWFAEQYANYIGHYFPATGRFQLYPLPRFTIPDPGNPGKTLSLPNAPNDLALDAHGTVWFTEFNADAVGRLDPQTGRMQHYPLSAKRSVQTLLPYGVTVDSEGMVWFTEASNDHLGRLDPSTGHIRFFTPPGPNGSLMEISSDAHGIIWATAFSSGLLLRLDPHTGTFTRYDVSPTGNQAGGLYGLVVSPAGDVWVTILNENMLARLDAATNRFSYYSIPTSSSEPLALAMDANHTLWFIEINKLGMLRS